MEKKWYQLLDFLVGKIPPLYIEKLFNHRIVKTFFYKLCRISTNYGVSWYIFRY